MQRAQAGKAHLDQILDEIAQQLSVENDVFRTETAVRGLNRERVANEEQDPQADSEEELVPRHGDTLRVKVPPERLLLGTDLEDCSAMHISTESAFREGLLGLTLVFDVAVRLLLLDEETFPDGKDAALRLVRRQEVRRALVDRAFEGRRRKAFVPVAFDHGVPLREECVLLLHRCTLDDPPRDSFTGDFATGVFV